MGSLMAGWDSPVLGDDIKARRMRNQSLTNEEVEAFWRQQGKPVPEDGVTSPLASPGRTMEKSSKQWNRSPMSPVAHGHYGIGTDDADANAAGQSPGKSRDWWTRSNWAFLNEPPQEEEPGTAHSYTPQFHVAADQIATRNA